MYKLITAPTVLPVSLEAFKRNINFPETDESKDAHFSLLLNIAADEATRFTGRALAPTVYTFQTNEFTQAVTIVKPPVTVVSEVKYFDASNEGHTLVSGTDYTVYLLGDTAEIHFTNDLTLYDRPDALQITFTTGYATEAEVPPAIKGALLFAATDYYMNPGDNVRNLPTKAKSLLRNYRLHSTE